MITKILNIQNIGRLRETGGSNSKYELAKNTFIYAGNTHGKSTFTAILRSLNLDNSSLVIGRKTFNAEKQLVNLSFGDGTTEQFNSRGWTGKKENIRIFDAKYVQENFFSPDQQIDDSDQKKIETFILGSKGVSLAAKVQELTVQQNDNVTKRSRITGEYNKTKKLSGPTFEDFLKIRKLPNAEKELQSQQNLLESYNNQTKIQSLIDEAITNLELFDFNDHKKKLEPKFEADFTKISAHISRHIKPGADKSKVVQFLGSGVTLSKSTDKGGGCVFCGQEIGDDATELLKVYSDYFSQEYKRLSSNRRVSQDFFANWNIVSDIRRNILDLEKLKVDVDIEELDSILENAIKDFSKEIELKQDLNHGVDFDSAKAIRDTVSALLVKFKKLGKDYEGDLKTEVNKCAEEIIRLEIAIKRYEKYWLEKCNEYKDLQKDHNTNISPNLATAIKQQNQYADTIFSTCQKDINDCLDKLGADFRVEKLKFKGRARNDLFSLVFFGNHKVGITETAGQYSIKTTLSDSDKRLLCFAFFMASLKNDPELASLIVILDDPVSSFDFERRNSTTKYLKELTESTVTQSQLIILTHDRDFIYMLSKENVVNNKFLILEWSESAASSDFELLDPDTHPMFMSTFYKKLHDLREFLLLKDSELNVGHLANIRIILENILKHKYYDRLGGDIKANKSIETFIETLSQPNAPYASKTELIADIRSLLPNITHHDQSNPGGYNIEALGTVDIRNKIKDLFSIMEKL